MMMQRGSGGDLYQLVSLQRGRDKQGGVRMDYEAMAELIKRARKDPEFFHALVWKTATVVESLDFLTREEKAAIVAIKPEDLVVGLATGRIRVGGDPAADCGATCGASCGASCGATCGGSCGGSCTATCAVSCAASGDVADGAALIREITQSLGGARPFSRFTRGE